MTVSGQIRERVLQLRAEKKTVRDIAAELTIGKSTVSDILKAAKTAPASEQTASEQTAQASEPDAVATEIEKPEAHIEEMPIPQLIISEEAASGFLSELQAPAPPAETKEAAQQDAFISQFAAKMRKQEPDEQEQEQEMIEQLIGKRATKAKAPPKAKAPKAPKEPKEEAPAKAPKAPPEPPLDKGHMIAKITSLLTSFPGLFANHIKDSAKFIESLPGRSAADLKTQLELLESTRSIASGAMVLHALFGTVAGGVEIIGGKVGLQTQGYQRLMLSQDGALREIFRDIAFENSTKLKAIQRPELRLAMLMCQTLMAVDSMNRRAPAAPAPPVSEAPAQAAPATEAATVAPETADKFADL